MDFVGWEKLSLVDFDHRLTTTLFMAGCPFRCPFCHNSDLVLRPGSAAPIPWEEIETYLKKRRNMLDAVCISGGEPTLMDDLEEKLKIIKSLGYVVKLDSNGWNPFVLERLIGLGLVDYIAMDIKNSRERYAETAGTSVNLDTIDHSVRLLMNSGIDYEFRTTIVDEFHDEFAMQGIAEWIAGAKRYYLQRFVENEHCIEKGLHAVTKEKAEGFLKILSPAIPSVRLRDYD